MKYHQEKYGHTTWHWTNVPESILLESGYINDFNRLRLKRKESYERDGVYYNPIQEYGLDGFAEEKCADDQVIYHGIQAKLWDPKSLLTANDLGTFQAVIWGGLRMKSSDSKGYLYHTCRLQADLLGYILNTRGIIQQELLPFDDSHVKSITLPSPTEEISHVQESTYTLRGYQEEAIKALNEEWSGVGLLNLPCGTGKTVIFSNHLREKKYKNVIIVSPLRVHAEQTLKRVKAFLPEYDQLLLDSDGSTDVDVLNDVMEKRSVISTTFKSFVQVVRQLFVETTKSDDDEEEDEEDDEDDEDKEEEDDEEEDDEEVVEDDHSESSSKESVYESLIDLSDTLVIIDEAHNIVSMSDEKQEMIKIIQSFPKTLLVTATPPSAMEEMIGCTTIYQYPFRRAIDEGHICDYQVYLPMITTDEATGESSVYIEKPVELASLDGDMVQKSLYLLSGMLQTGSRRCIAYLSETKECNLFMKVLNETNQKYHYLDLSVSSITNLTSGSKRKKILEEFQKDDGRGEIKILCSIRILDEGVDIPECDSIFIGNVTESSNEIKMVQRICRANRLVDDRPNKVARCFLWADDYRKIIGSLSLLKENDIEFHKKIKAINGDYEKSGDVTRIDIVGKHNASLMEFIKIKCISYEEIWEMKRQFLFKFVDDNGMMPSQKSKDTDEKRLGQWYNNQLKHIKSAEHDFYKKFSENEIVKNAMDKTIRERGIDKWDENKKALMKFVVDRERMPSQNSKDAYADEKRLGQWYNDQLNKITTAEHELYKRLSENEIVKEAMDKTIRERGIDKWDENKKALLTFVVDRERMPSTIGKDTDEKRLAHWYSGQLKKIKSAEHDFYKKFSENEIVKNAMDKTIRERGIDKWGESNKALLKFVDDNGKMPSKNSKDADEKRLAQWYNQQITKITSTKHDFYKKLSENEIVKNAMDKTIRERGIDKWDESKKALLKFVDDHERMPSDTHKDVDEKRLANWYSGQLKKIKSAEHDFYKKLSENEIVKNAMDKTIQERGIDKWNENKKALMTFVVDRERMPSTISKDPGEKRLARWYGEHLRKITSTEHDYYKKLSVNEIVKKAMDNTLLNRSKRSKK